MKLVLTGGPSGGKTTLAMAMLRHYGARIAMVSEAATILYGGGFRRRTHLGGIRIQQKIIYNLQVEHEKLVELENPDSLIVCDRGTVDGLAYWPENGGSLWEMVESDHRTEINRYEWVIHMDTASSLAYDRSNPVRVESFEEADLLNLRVRDVWGQHPQRFIIPNMASFSQKVDRALLIVDGILNGLSYSQIIAQLQAPPAAAMA